MHVRMLKRSEIAMGIVQAATRVLNACAQSHQKE